MLTFEPKYFLRPRKTNSKNKIISIGNEFTSSDIDIEKIKLNYFKIDLSSKQNNKSKNKDFNNRKKTNISEINEICNSSYFDMAINNYNKGFYKLSLENAFNSLEKEKYNTKVNYIILLCYLKMYDIDSAEKFLKNIIFLIYLFIKKFFEIRYLLFVICDYVLKFGCNF